MNAKKSLGQNFLINDNIIEEIVSLLDVQEDDLIIEIGPGRGALTKYLSKLSAQLLCIEIDNDLKEYLINYNVIYDDILKLDLKQIISSYKFRNLYIIGNLPYYITSPILEHIINSNIKPLKMIFMVQKEVADRYSALPGSKEYGYMTVFLNLFYDVSQKIFVSKNNFNPMPKVDSEVIELKLKEQIIDIDYNNFIIFAKECFKYKRKTLKNNLKNLNFIIDGNKRAEEYSLKELIELYKEYKNIK